MQQSLRVVSPPAELPVSLAVAKGHLRLDFDDDDDLLRHYLATAVELCEAFQGRALVTQTLSYTVGDRLPPAYAYGLANVFLPPLSLSWSGLWQRGLMLPRAPVQSVVSVGLTSYDGVQTTLAATDYQKNLDLDPARIRLTALGGTSAAGLTSVTFVAGYGGASAVPRKAVQAVLMLAAWLYENRGDSGTDPEAWPSAIRALLWPDRLLSFA